MNSKSFLTVLVVFLPVALTNGCGGPNSTPHASQPADRPSTNRHAEATKTAVAPGTGAVSISPIDSAVIDHSVTPVERVINSALASLKLRLEVQAENDPQKRAALEKKLQQVKFARQSIYARE